MVDGETAQPRVADSAPPVSGSAAPRSKWPAADGTPLHVREWKSAGLPWARKSVGKRPHPPRHRRAQRSIRSHGTPDGPGRSRSPILRSSGPRPVGREARLCAPLGGLSRRRRGARGGGPPGRSAARAVRPLHGCLDRPDLCLLGASRAGSAGLERAPAAGRGAGLAARSRSRAELLDGRRAEVPALPPGQEYPKIVDALSESLRSARIRSCSRVPRLASGPSCSGQ